MYNSSFIYNALEAGFGVIAIIILFVYIFATAFLGRWVAEKKGYSENSWFWICFFFGVIGLIAIAGAPTNTRKENVSKPMYVANYKEEAKPGEEKCPHCGGYYDFAFKKCPHCGKDRNFNDISHIRREDKIESQNIKCDKCNRMLSIDGKIEDFKQYVCPYCKNKITEKNVLFSE